MFLLFLEVLEIIPINQHKGRKKIEGKKTMEIRNVIIFHHLFSSREEKLKMKYNSFCLVTEKWKGKNVLGDLTDLLYAFSVTHYVCGP